jgi:hypothetical protein
MSSKVARRSSASPAPSDRRRIETRYRPYFPVRSLVVSALRRPALELLGLARLAGYLVGVDPIQSDPQLPCDVEAEVQLEVVGVAVDDVHVPALILEECHVSRWRQTVLNVVVSR